VNAKQQIKYNDWMPHDPIAEIELHNRRVLKSLLIEMAVEEFSAPNSDTRHLQLALSLQANLTRQTLNGKRALPPAEHEQLVLPAVELRQPLKQLEAPTETTARRSPRDDQHDTTAWRVEILAWTLRHEGELSMLDYHDHYSRVFGKEARISRTRFGAVVSWMMRLSKFLEQVGPQRYRLTPKGREFIAANGITATSGFTRKEAPTTPEPPPVEEGTHTHRTDLKHRMIAHAKAHGGKFLLTQWAASEKAIGKYGGVGGGAYTYLRDKKLFRYTGPGEYTLVARAAK
jgi:hypothetical protein